MYGVRCMLYLKCINTIKFSEDLYMDIYFAIKIKPIHVKEGNCEWKTIALITM